MAIQTKIDKYCNKFIESNFDKKDRKKDESLKFEWFVNSMHCWYHSSQSYNSKPHIGKDISLGSAQGGDAFFVIINNQIFSMNDNIDEILEDLSNQGTKPTIIFHLIQTKKSNHAKLGDFKKFVEVPLKIFKGIGIDKSQRELFKLKSFIEKILEGSKSAEHKFELFFYTEKNENDIKQLKQDWNSDIEFTENEYKSYTNVRIDIRGSEFLNSRYEEFTSNDFKLIVKKENLKSIDNDGYLIGYVTATELLDCIAKKSSISNERVLAPDVFQNNVRLYLGATEINKNFEKTLISVLVNLELVLASILKGNGDDKK